MHEEKNYTIRKIVGAHKVNYNTFNMLALTVLTVLLWMFEIFPFLFFLLVGLILDFVWFMIYTSIGYTSFLQAADRAL